MRSPDARPDNEPQDGVPDASRNGLRGLLPAAAAILAILAGATVLIARSDNGQTAAPATAQPSVPVAVSGEFGQHYAGLRRRRESAGVPTMMQTMTSRVHYHPLLAIFVDGRRIAVPANVGIDPADDPMNMAGLHTHDATGTIHVEGVDHATLGEFFQIWGVALSATRLGGHVAGRDEAVRMWVDGKPSAALGALRLRDGQRIVVSVGRKDAPAPALGAASGSPS